MQRYAILNELSFPVHPTSRHEALELLEQILQTVKQAKAKYNIAHVKYDGDLQNFFLTPDYSVMDWLKDRNIKGVLKDNFQALFLPPHIPEELEEEITELYVNHAFFLNRNTTTQKCEGLKIAYLTRSLAVSINNHADWDTPVLELTVQPPLPQQSVSVYHCAKEDHLEDAELHQFIHRFTELRRENVTADRLVVFFPNYEFSDQAIADINHWRGFTYEFERLMELLYDIPKHPFTGGKGKTEKLAHEKDICSKRITPEHRLTYSLIDTKIFIHRCRTHYD